MAPSEERYFWIEIETRERDIEARALGIFEEHEFGVAVALIDFLQSLILADAVFDVDDVVADLQIAEVGEEGGDFGFRAAAGRETTRSDSSNRSRAPKMARCGVGEDEAVGDVGLDEAWR